MVDPYTQQTDGSPNRNILPLMNGEIRGEDFVVSVDMESQDIYVQFQGWIVAYGIEQMLEEAYGEVWGNTVDPGDLEFDVGDDDDET